VAVIDRSRQQGAYTLFIYIKRKISCTQLCVIRKFDGMHMRLSLMVAKTPKATDSNSEHRKPLDLRWAKPKKEAKYRSVRCLTTIKRKS
jgi:hypothetical protein